MCEVMESDQLSKTEIDAIMEDLSNSLSKVLERVKAQLEGPGRELAGFGVNSLEFLIEFCDSLLEKNGAVCSPEKALLPYRYIDLLRQPAVSFLPRSTNRTDFFVNFDPRGDCSGPAIDALSKDLMITSATLIDSLFVISDSIDSIDGYIHHFDLTVMGYSNWLGSR